MTEENKSVKNFPNLRFKGFEGAWEVKKMGEIADIKTGNKDTQNKVDNGMYPFFVRSNTVEKINTYSYDGEAILTSGDGVGVGKNFHYVKGKFDFHQRVYSIRNFKKGYDGKYVYNIFSEKFYDRVIRLSAKNSVDSVRMNMISEMKISFPMFNEQLKIASFLTMIRDRIQTQKKIIEQFETLMRANREKLFSQKLRFKDEQGNNFLSWERKKIKEILTIGSGKDYKHLNDGAIPVYGTGGIITFVDSFLYDGETVCIGRKGTIDKPLYYNGKIWTVDTLFYTYSFNNSVPKFVFNIFQNINWKEYNEASGVPSLSKNTIEKIEISIPCIEEQTKIANFLSLIQEKIETEKQILEKLELQKRFLLANLFV